MQSFAVIFDMDGVLVDSNPTHKQAILQFCQKYDLSLTEEDFADKIFGRTSKDWLTYVLGELTPEQLEQYSQEKEVLFRELYAPLVQPLKGVMSFLRTLHEERIPRALATSAPPENVRLVLDKMKAWSLFDVIIDQRDVENSKPHPEIFLKTAKYLRLDPNCCVVFEDSLSGIMAAKSAGMQVIGVATTHSHTELVHTKMVIDDFEAMTVQTLQALFTQ